MPNALEGTLQTTSPFHLPDKLKNSSLAKSSCNEVRVLTIYNQSAENNTPGGQTNLQLEINRAIGKKRSALMNTGISTSDLDIVYVGKEFVAFESIDPSIPNWIDDINALINDVDATQLRDAYTADLVILMTGIDYGGISGVAGTDQLENERTYAMVEHNFANAPRFSYAHELGHLLGCKHEFAQDSGCVPLPPR